MDKGKYVATEEGSAQGNIISPVLANIYALRISIMV